MTLHVELDEDLRYVRLWDSQTMAERGSVKISLPAWESLRQDIIAGHFTPQIHRRVVTVHIGDVPSAPILGRGEVVVTCLAAWEQFEQEIMGGAYRFGVPGDGGRGAVDSPAGGGPAGGGAARGSPGGERSGGGGPG